jgi:hypothetical protein
MEDLLINMGITALLGAIKNPKKKATFKKAFLKIFKAIWTAFGNDEEFKAVVGVE